jgi:hypothetical protein
MATLDIPMESRMASNLPHAELPSLGSLGTFYNNRLETVLKNAFAGKIAALFRLVSPAR